jgi:hypothetical protein
MAISDDDEEKSWASCSGEALGEQWRWAELG